MNLFSASLSRKSVMALAVVGTLALSACGSSDSSTPATNADGLKTLRVTMVPGVSSLPLKVAEQDGIFEKNGLKVEFTEGLDVSAWQSAAGKQFDIVFTNSAVYAPSIAKGLDNTIINNTTNASDDYVSVTLATKEKLNKLSDLKGKKLGAPTLTGLTAESFKYLMAKEGVKANEYEIVQMPYSNQPDNLKAGNIDAALTANPYYGTLEREGLVMWGKDLGVEAHKAATGGKVDTASSSMYAANTQWVEANTDTVDAWIKSLDEAIKVIESDDAEARKVLKEWMKMSDQLAKDAIIPEYTTKVDADQQQATWDVLKSNGTISGDFPADRIKVYQG